MRVRIGWNTDLSCPLKGWDCEDVPRIASFQSSGTSQYTSLPRRSKTGCDAIFTVSNKSPLSLFPSEALPFPLIRRSCPC